MIKITVFPNRIINMSESGWDYLRTIIQHIAKFYSQVTSLIDYAIRFNELCRNVEMSRVFHIAYTNASILIYSNADWSNRQSELVQPIAVIENDPVAF